MRPMTVRIFDGPGGALLCEETLGLRVLPGGQVALQVDCEAPPAGAAWIEVWDGDVRVLRGSCQTRDKDAEPVTHGELATLGALIRAKLDDAPQSE